MKGDHTFLFCFFVLLGIGLIILTSASFAIACQKFNDCYFYLKHQLLVGYLPGLLFFFFFSSFNYQLLRKFALPFLVLSIAFLSILFIPGLGISHGAAVQWINLKFISFQPSEIVKLGLIIYLSAWFAGNEKEVFKKNFFPFIILFLIIEVLIIRQPDYGTAAIILILSLIIYFVAGAPTPRFIAFLLLGIISFVILTFFSPYHLSRITTFFNPTAKPLEAGYQVNQSLLAIGAGGSFGRVLGHSIQKYFYLPEVIGDSIFAVMAEELGFVLTLLVIGLYVYIFLRIFDIALKSKDKFGKLLSFGIGSWFMVQFLINVSGMLNLLPLTGTTLPFLSYGGTSFCTFAAAFGIVYNVSKRSGG